MKLDPSFDEFVASGSARLLRSVYLLKLDPSFDEFVASGSARLLRSVYLLTGDREHSEDLLQITLVRTARRWEAARNSPHAYAHQVLVNVLHDRRRNLGRRPTEQRLDEFEDRLRPVMDGAQALVDRMAITYQLNGGPGRDTLFWADPIRDHSTIVGRFTFVVR